MCEFRRIKQTKVTRNVSSLEETRGSDINFIHYPYNEGVSFCLNNKMFQSNRFFLD